MSDSDLLARKLLAEEFETHEVTAAAARRLRNHMETEVESAAVRVIASVLTSQPKAAVEPHDGIHSESRSKDQDAPPVRRVELAAEHQGMRVDYNGMLRQVRAALGEPALSEMVHQLKGHLTELGKRWYAGDRLVVDEFLQLYCIGVEARRGLTAGQLKAHG
ncbi:hypothetical protein QE400_000053 [Xanthomonas sacchari]|uniref:hypothetical protein n=1 Tax=Xanthomonas sacchari TaxID=56458 RepID=UPI00277E2E75|nr:hypothetical protein [Xanthomonas sacchari]MDQ1090640.1 hypothetical protein [Xanthomonas sacchari]